MSETNAIPQQFELPLNTQIHSELGDQSEAMLVINALERQRNHILNEMWKQMALYLTGNNDGDLPDELEIAFEKVFRLNDLIGMAIDANQHVFKQLWQQVVTANLPQKGGESHAR